MALANELEKTRVFYDTEFIDDGETIDLVSIGMVAEDPDGNESELYLVSWEFSTSAFANSPWLVENVLPSLPYKLARATEVSPARLVTDRRHEDDELLRLRSEIASEVSHFLKKLDNVELWGYYAAYDHVALAQLFGPMAFLPPHVPMRTNDLAQWAEQRNGVDPRKLDEMFPRRPQEANHKAIGDARWNLRVHRALSGYAEGIIPR